MAHILADRTRESATVIGTGDFTLSGAVTNFDDFAASMANGDTCHYCAVSAAGGWEVALGTKTSGGLARTTVLQSSNADAKVNFNAGGSGVVDVYMVVPASVMLTSLNAGAALKTTAANIWAGTNDALFMTAKNAADAGAPQTLTDAATIAWDMALGFNAKVTLGGNRTIGTPTNPIEGRYYTLQIIQPASGGPRTIAYPSSTIFDWGGATAMVASTAANKVDVLTLFCYDAATPKFRVSANKGS